jgi:leucyl aminopeptidase (aminopeptidase T)
MRRLPFVIVPIVFAVALAAQPRLTFDYPAIAKRLVQQLGLKPGERVMSIAHPGTFDDLIPYIRYEVIRAGGVDLGVVEVLREPVPDAFDPAVLQKGAREARAHYKAMFRDVDAAIMMPGANTSHPAYLAMQDWLKDDLTARRGRRTIHFHWVENGSAYPIAGQPLPSRPEMDAVYQRALLQTDYRALGEVERRFAAALKSGEVHITSPGGTDLRFRAGDRPANLQDGDASAARTAQGQVLVDHEIELPAGVVRVAPIEDTVDGVIAFPPSQWDGRPVDGLRLRFAKGRVVEIAAASGRDAVEAEMRKAGDPSTGSGQAPARRFREFALGFNPLLAVPDRTPWIPYYGYGAGVVRLSLGDNTELGGQVAAAPGQPAYVRWNFFTDLTVTVGTTTWVRNGTLQ